MFRIEDEGPIALFLNYFLILVCVAALCLHLEVARLEAQIRMAEREADEIMMDENEYEYALMEDEKKGDIDIV